MPDLGHIDGRRVLAVVIALCCTTLGMPATDSSHPPGGATARRLRLSRVVTSQKKLLLGGFIFPKKEDRK